MPSHSMAPNIMTTFIRITELGQAKPMHGPAANILAKNITIKYTSVFFLFSITFLTFLILILANNIFFSGPESEVK